MDANDLINALNNNTIEQYVPAGVVLTETQKNYLQAVVTLAANQDQVKMIDVAHYLDKSTSAVNSAMKMLSQKGVLETDHSGVITLTKNESQQTKKPKKETQKGSEKAEKEARKTDAKPKKELKAASGKNSPVKEKEYVTADVLDQSSDGEKFTGITYITVLHSFTSIPEHDGFIQPKLPSTLLAFQSLAHT